MLWEFRLCITCIALSPSRRSQSTIETLPFFCWLLVPPPTASEPKKVELDPFLGRKNRILGSILFLSSFFLLRFLCVSCLSRVHTLFLATVVDLIFFYFLLSIRFWFYYNLFFYRLSSAHQLICASVPTRATLKYVISRSTSRSVSINCSF